MDFYDAANEHLAELNESERRIFQHVVRNIAHVKDLSVRELAAECLVSTATVVRFAKKLGYSGYRELSAALRDSDAALRQTSLPAVVWREGYAEDYLKNVLASVEALTPAQVGGMTEALRGCRRVYCIGDGPDGEVARYAYRELFILGFDVLLVEWPYEMDITTENVSDDDVVLVFSLGGEDRRVISYVERTRRHASPTVVSITKADNNTIQGLSDANAFVFTDLVTYRGHDLTSRVSMYALLDLICYELVRDAAGNKDS